MPIDFYYLPQSPPCRTVLMVAEALGLELKLKPMNRGDSRDPEFLKINPQHTIPTIVDNGFVLWESRAIITYLVNTYGKGSSLYPEDPETRALVDQRLYFDIATLYQRHTDYIINPQHTVPTIVDNGFALWESQAIITYLVNKYGKGSSLYPEDAQARAVVDQRLFFDLSILSEKFFDYIYPQLYGGSADEAKLKKIDEGLEFLEKFLEGQQWVAGNNLTLADISILATVSNFHTFDIDIFKYPNIKGWFERMKSAPGYSKNVEGAAIFASIIKDFKKKTPSS